MGAPSAPPNASPDAAAAAGADVTNPSPAVPGDRATAFADRQAAKRGETPDPVDEKSTASDQPPAGDGDDAAPQDTAPDEGDAAPDAAADAPAATDEADDLPDEVINDFAQAYKDRILSSEAFTEEVSRRVKEQVETQVTEAMHGREQEAEVEALIEQGTKAINGITSLAELAKREIETKAKSDEDFDAVAVVEGILDPQKLATHLREYGAAIVADVARNYDRAIETSFLGLLRNKLPALDGPQTEELERIIATARRMEGDPKQSKQSKAFFVAGLLDFVYARAHGAGQAHEREQAGKKSSVSKRIADSNAVKAAQARLAAQKGNPPPAAPPGKPATDAAPSGAYDSDYYRQLKREGRHDEAQDYAMSFSTRRVPATV